MPPRALIWIAVSTRPQAAEDRDSLAAQEREARALCEREGWQIIDVLVVPGHSRDYLDIFEMARDMRAKGIDAADKMLAHWEAADFDILIARDADRFAREQALHSYFISRTVRHCRARIYTFSTGWVDDSNYLMFAAMSGYKASADNAGRVRMHNVGMAARVSRGLHPNNVPLSHRIVRDASGKALRLVINEELRPLWSDLAACLLAGVSFEHIEFLLFQRGHLDPRTGLMFSPLYFYQLLYNPYFWGHSARRYYRKGFGPWRYDPASPAPLGVEIHYNTHQPVYEGGQAYAIQSELRRRQEVIKGRATPATTSRFSGLLICAICGRRLAAHAAPPRRKYICEGPYRNNPRSRHPCPVHTRVSEATVQRFVHNLFQEIMLTGGPPILSKTLARNMPGPDPEREVHLATRRLNALIEQKVNAPAVAHPLYDAKIAEAAAQLESRQRALIEFRHNQESPQILAARDIAWSELVSEGLDHFWTRTDGEINQALVRILGKLRMEASKDAVLRLIPAPPHHQILKSRRRRSLG